MNQHRTELTAYKAALDDLAIVAVCDEHGYINYVNEQFCKISQYHPSELIGQKHSLINSGYHPRDFFSGMWRTITKGQRWHGEICNLTKNGQLYWVDTTIAPVIGDYDKIEGYVSIRFDITARKAAESALIVESERRGRAEMLLRDVVETIPDGIATYDSSDNLLLCNRAFRTFYRVASPVIAEGASVESIVDYALEKGQFGESAEAPEWYRSWRQAREQGDRRPNKSMMQQLCDGRWLKVQERRSQAGHLVSICTDVTDIKNAERLIKLQAERDPLTGLANRAVFQERLTWALNRYRRSSRMGALILIDLDKFKDINDTLGHDAGDELLVEIGDRLKKDARRSDLIARLGGDEFAIILPRVPSRKQLIQTISRIRANLGQPVNLGRKIVTVDSSIGVALFPRDGLTPKAVLKNADIALYEAKARGRNTYCFFQPALRAQLKRRDHLTDSLRAAITAQGVDIALQPQISFTTGEHVGFEVLARWRNHGQEIAPSEFIPVSEETGLIVPLGNLILEKALSNLARLRAADLNPGFFAINVAAAQLKHDGFVSHLSNMLAHNGLKPSDLDIEVTEKVLFDTSTGRIRQTLFDLHNIGCKIALDDFGTGYASLTHLKQYPVSRLKIDQSFVRGITRNPLDSAIPMAIINLAHNLGMTVVAEGIEDDEQYTILKKHGCDFGQGYLLGRPLEGTAVDDYLAEIGVTKHRSHNHSKLTFVRM